MKIAVFCSSSDNVSPFLFAESERLGEFFAREGHELIYGGAVSGCMGAFARGALNRKGRLIGVIPEMDFMQGIVQEGLSEQHVVPTLSSRKDAMIRLAEGFLVFPGGLGTLDEALEVLALKSIGTLNKPVVFYNYLDLWTPFLEAMDLLVQQRLIRQPLEELLTVLDKPEQLREHFRYAL